MLFYWNMRNIEKSVCACCFHSIRVIMIWVDLLSFFLLLFFFLLYYYFLWVSVWKLELGIFVIGSLLLEQFVWNIICVEQFFIIINLSEWGSRNSGSSSDIEILQYISINCSNFPQCWIYSNHIIPMMWSMIS